MAGPLEGLKVIDFTRFIAGPGVGMYLADQGADVIKIEPPDGTSRDRRGDVFPPSQTWLVHNRSKRSIILDLRKPEGFEVVCKLVKQADVMLVTSQPGGVERLGLGYEAMRTLNPRLVYASITGWGQAGPHRMKLGYDYLLQAFSGIMESQRAPDGTPVGTTFMPADQSIPMILSYAITLALLRREKTGLGQKVETSQLQAQLGMQGVRLVFDEGGQIDQMPATSWRRPPHTYRAQDEKWLVLIGLTKTEWHTLWPVLGLGDFPEDPRLEGMRWPPELEEELHGQMAEVFLRKPRKEWLALLEQAGLHHICAPVLSGKEMMDEPQVRENGMVLEQDYPMLGKVKMIAPPFTMSVDRPGASRPAPGFGEHTTEIMLELGYATEGIAALREKGAVR